MSSSLTGVPKLPAGECPGGKLFVELPENGALSICLRHLFVVNSPLKWDTLPEHFY